MPENVHPHLPDLPNSGTLSSATKDRVRSPTKRPPTRKSSVAEVPAEESGGITQSNKMEKAEPRLSFSLGGSELTQSNLLDHNSSTPWLFPHSVTNEIAVRELIHTN